MTRAKKGDNVGFILDKLNDEAFKEHALLAIENGVSLRNVLRIIGTTYQTVYSAEWDEVTMPKYLKDRTPRFLFCQAVKHAIAHKDLQQTLWSGEQLQHFVGCVRAYGIPLAVR